MIETKSKKCKGNGKAIGYGCGKLTKYRKYGLGKSCCYASWLYTSDNGKIELSKALNKVQKPRREFEKAKAEKSNRSGLTTLLESVKTICHKYIRERDKYKPCISCGTQWHKDFQAGHFYPAGKFSTIRFNEFNINGQCQQCNLRKEGNVSQYRLSLPNRIGKTQFELLNHLAGLENKTGYKWDREELKKLRKYYTNKLKEL